MSIQIIYLSKIRYESVFVKIDDLPFYNEDLETPEQAPAEWTRFREEVRGLDGVVFVTPEYNRSVPAVLKNALDVGSRPYGHSVWDHKPVRVQWMYGKDPTGICYFLL
ncbi:hypothetical protein EfmAA610_19800 [Enterococcus faecium]|nr:hypothetical protein EfmAA610_19800 [Enterococcus faecium]